MIDPDTMQAWSDADRQRAEAWHPVVTGRPSADVMALEVRLRSLFVGELEARVVVAVRDAIAPIMRDVEDLRSRVFRLEGAVVPALRAEVARLSSLHPTHLGAGTPNGIGVPT